MLFSSVTRWLKPSRRAARPRPPRPRRRIRPQLEALEDRLAPATFTVINTNESGPGSLYAAIQQSNSTPGLQNEIDFNIPGPGVHTIHLMNTPLPAITQSVNIDGYTQPGAAPATQNSPANLVIELDGAGYVGQADGLDIKSTDCSIQGLVINRFTRNGIAVDPGGTAGIAGNYIGTDATGTKALGNGVDGIALSSGGNHIGLGISSLFRNVISGNGFAGIFIDGATATGNVIEANYIGTDATGTNALANGTGIILYSGDNTVGGVTPAQRNVLSGNGAGITIAGPAATGNVIEGNYIGTDATGTGTLSNTQDGIQVTAAPNTVIGGAAAGAGNLISANLKDGIHVQSAITDEILGNLIGTDISGSLFLGNGVDGIALQNTTNSLIGENVISGNHGDGVDISGAQATGNQVTGNLIGTDKTGTKARGNFFYGVYILDGSNNDIGGPAAGAGNVISANAKDGVRLDGAGGSNTVQGNLIGTDINGTAVLSNGHEGVGILSTGNQIGGTAPGAGNVISGSALYGVVIFGANGVQNVVQGNKIGTDVTGTKALGNYNGVGVLSPNNQIGGTAAGAGNVIAHSSAQGVDLQAPGNAILGNSIFDNLTGIGLQSPQEAPVLLAATPSAAGTTVTGKLHSTPNHTFRIELFSNSGTDKAGVAEGQTFLGFVDVTTDPTTGDAPFTFVTTALPAGSLVTATATDNTSNTTSLFSASIPVSQALPSQAPAITSANNATFTMGAAGTFTFTTTGLPVPSLMESGSLPGNVQFTDNGNGTATLAGTPTVAGQFPITITASNGTPPDATQSFTLTVLPVTTSGAPLLVSASSTTFVQGTAGAFTVTATGSPTPSLSESGSLPNGVQFIDLGNGTASLTGTPTVAGQFTFTITASNGVLPDATQSFTLTVLTPNQRFVQALYLDDLGRAGDLSNPTDAGYWVNLLDSGTLDQAAVAAGVVHSHEAQTRVVTGWYQAYLGRLPVGGEEQFWVPQLAQGQTEEQVLGGILGSDEFFARAQTLVGSGAAPERYVQALYQQLLNRPGSAAEVAYWVNLLPQLGRQGVAQGFLASTEYRTGVVTGDYSALLHRAPYAGEPAYWVFSDRDVARIRVGFEASPEFFVKG
jgi:hypothetical protein